MMLILDIEKLIQIIKKEFPYRFLINPYKVNKLRIINQMKPIPLNIFLDNL